LATVHRGLNTTPEQNVFRSSLKYSKLMSVYTVDKNVLILLAAACPIQVCFGCL